MKVGLGMQVSGPAKPGEWGVRPIAHFPPEPVDEVQDWYLSREDLVLSCAGRVGVGPGRRGLLLGADWRRLC